MKKEIQTINISIKFPKNEKVRRQANLIEDIFNKYYLQPTVVPIPDDIEPVFPRITLNSLNGHSQVSFSQISIDFNVNFSSNYKYDYNLCEKYIEERIKLIYDYLEQSDTDQIYYIGMTSQIKFISEYDYNEINEIQKYFLNNRGLPNLYDFNQKVTLLEDDKYFHNITIGNYRDYKGNVINGDIPAIVSFEQAQIFEKGILVTLDINNRYSYTIKGELTNVSLLKPTFEYLYAKNREWIDEKIFNFIPFNKEAKF